MAGDIQKTKVPRKKLIDIRAIRRARAAALAAIPEHRTLVEGSLTFDGDTLNFSADAGATISLYIDGEWTDVEIEDGASLDMSANTNGRYYIFVYYDTSFGILVMYAVAFGKTPSGVGTRIDGIVVDVDDEQARMVGAVSIGTSNKVLSSDPAGFINPAQAVYGAGAMSLDFDGTTVAGGGSKFILDGGAGAYDAMIAIQDGLHIFGYILNTEFTVPNNGFELGALTGWTGTGTPTVSAVEPSEGDYCLKLDGTTDAIKSTNFIAGATALSHYLMTVKAKIGPGAPQILASIIYYNAASAEIGRSEDYVLDNSESQDWRFFVITGTAPTGTTKMKLEFQFAAFIAGDIAYIDDIHLYNAYASGFIFRDNVIEGYGTLYLLNEFQVEGDLYGYSNAYITGNMEVGGDLDVTGTLTAGGLPTSGTYTPTLYNTTNIDASTAYVCQYMRVGNVVTVSGKVDVDPTAVGNTVLGMSIPVASAIAANEEIGGVGVEITGITSAAIYGNVANNRCYFRFYAPRTDNISFTFSFTYQVI